MAPFKRNKALLPDSLTARFLYAIIKQLDLKSVDWNLVAESLEITNGHAARMRYTRFKNQVEGSTAQSKASKGPAKRQEKEDKVGLEVPAKGKKRDLEMENPSRKEDISTAPSHVKTEGADLGFGQKRIRCEGGTNVKLEREYVGPSNAVEPQVRIKTEAGLNDTAELATVVPEEVQPPSPSAPQIKRDPDKANNDAHDDSDIWRVLPLHPDTAATSSNLVPTTYDHHEESPRTTPALSTFSPAAAAAEAAAQTQHGNEQHHRHSSKQQQPARPTTVNLSDLEISPRSQPCLPTSGSTLAHSLASGAFGVSPLGHRRCDHDLAAKKAVMREWKRAKEERDRAVAAHDLEGACPTFKGMDWGKNEKKRGQEATVFCSGGIGIGVGTTIKRESVDRVVID